MEHDNDEHGADERHARQSSPDVPGARKAREPDPAEQQQEREVHEYVDTGQPADLERPTHFSISRASGRLPLLYASIFDARARAPDSAAIDVTLQRPSLARPGPENPVRWGLRTGGNAGNPRGTRSYSRDLRRDWVGTSSARLTLA